jgi:ferritin-like metal-binding protein YciE
MLIEWRRKARSSAAKVFGLVGAPARAKPCEALSGILEEANEIGLEFKNSRRSSRPIKSSSSLLRSGSMLKLLDRLS